MDNFVERALQEGGIYRVVRLHAFRRHCGAQYGGVFLADADVKCPIGKGTEKASQPQTVSHCRRYGNDFTVIFGETRQLLTERGRIFRLGGRTGADAVRFLRRVFRERLPLPLFRNDVQQHAAVFQFLFCPFERG